MPEINEVFEDIKANLEAAIARETQIRVTYETSLIPDLQRDLQASRDHVIALTSERDALLKWKASSETALALCDRALRLLSEAMDSAPGEKPLG